MVTRSGRVINENEIVVKAEKEEEFTFEIEDKHKLLSPSKDEDKESKTFKGRLIIDENLIKSEESITIIIDSLYSHAKAEAPLEIKGQWKIEVPIK
ncbi:MAG: hypothetical protein AB2417_19750 [Clostridiaceae bacterium]